MTRTRQWTMGTAVLVLLILVGGWFLLVAPKHASADELRASTTTQESTNLSLAAEVSMLKAQQAGLPAQEAKLALIRQHIPENPALPSFVRSLSALAKASYVTLQTIAPVPPTANTSPPVNPAGTTKPAGVVPQLQTVGLTINLLGTYPNVELFLNRLESLQRAFLVTGLQVTPGTTTTTGVTGSGSPSLAVIITARVFDVSTIGAAGGSTTTGSATTGSTCTGSTATTAH
jgi:hypothetical protein